MSLALLFPGQGAQQPGMLGALPDTAGARAVVAESRSICGELGLPDDLDRPDLLHDTVATQVSLVIAGVGWAQALIADSRLTPRVVAGHSVGAFASAVAAGVLTLREALVAVHLRGESMRAACSGGDWGMAALTGLPTRAVQQLVERIVTPEEPLWIANLNSATQTVLGGTATALNAAHDAARLTGAAAFERLDIAVASHGPVQGETASALRTHLAALPLRSPTARYVTNTGGRVVGTAQAILTDLADSVAHPVRWYDGVRLMAELGVTCSIETAPGHTLTRLVRAGAPDVTALSVSDDGVTAVAARAHRLTG
jgi:malonate decarboxylase epsilon subunit